MKRTPGRRWAILRLVLGIGRVSGAAFAAGILLTGGINDLTLWAVLVTGLLTTTSLAGVGGGRR